MKKRKILVIGNPRSGTHTMANMLRTQLKLKVRHEHMADDGCVSCYYVVQPKYFIDGHMQVHKGETAIPYDQFENVVFQVRHPLRCLASMHKVVNVRHQKWWVDHDLLDPSVKGKMLRCMHAWYTTNLRCAAVAQYRVRLETLHKTFPSLMKACGIPCPDKIEVPQISKSSGYWKPKPLTWDDLFAIDEPLTLRIAAMAKHYRYKDLP